MVTYERFKTSIGSSIVAILRVVTLAAATASASNDDNNNNINSHLGCFTTFLKKEEIGLLLNNLWGVASIADLPAQLDSGQQNPDVVLKILLNMPIEQPRLNGLIVCLQDTGIVFA